MPERKSNPKRPRDLSLLASAITQIATEGEIEAAISEGKNPAAVALGRLGGIKGGRARAKKLTAKRRKEIAQKAASARWKKNA